MDMGWDGGVMNVNVNVALLTLHERPPDGHRGRWLEAFLLVFWRRMNEGVLWLGRVYAI